MALVRKLLDIAFKIFTSIELRISGIQDLDEDLSEKQQYTT